MDITQNAEFIQEATIQRCPHDGENPYAMISRNLIRDASISPECRWLLIFLLSNKDGWKICVNQIINHLKGHVGRNRVYALMKEAISAGYIYVEHPVKGNLKQGITYYLSENPKLKKSFRLPGNGEAENRDTENGHLKKEQEKKEYKKEVSIRPNSVHKSKPSASSPSAIASEVCDFFLKKIKEEKTDFKDPNLEKWAIEMDKLLRLDKRDPKKVLKIIEWVVKDDFWKCNILSPISLRKQFDRLEMRMAEKSAMGNREINQAVFSKIKAQDPDLVRHIQFTKHGVLDNKKGRDLSWNLPPISFEQALANMLGVRWYAN